MNLLPYLSDLTTSLIGTQICPHCNSEDLFFAFEGQCMECHKPIKRHSQEQTLKYSLHVLIEFLLKYDDQHPEEIKFYMVNELRKDLLFLNENGFLPEERFKSMKNLFQSSKSIGSKKFHAVAIITDGNSQLGFTFEFPNPMERMKTISAVLCALINLNLINK